jgi:hypothetical protein
LPCLQKRFDRLRPCSGSQEGGLRLRRPKPLVQRFEKTPRPSSGETHRRRALACQTRVSVQSAARCCLRASERANTQSTNAHGPKDTCRARPCIRSIRADGRAPRDTSCPRDRWCVSHSHSYWQSLWALLRAEAQCRLMQAHICHPLLHSFLIGSPRAQVTGVARPVVTQVKDAAYYRPKAHGADGALWNDPSLHAPPVRQVRRLSRFDARPPRGWRDLLE